jgi:thioredoxin 1
MSNALAVTDDTFETEVLRGDLPVVVDFWAEWCGPCRLIGPVLDELAREYHGRVKVTKLNVDENPTTSMRFRVQAIPTLLFFKDGQKVDQVVGAPSKPELKKHFDRVV